MKVQLRDYQQDTINQAKVKISEGKKRIIVYAPTGCHEKGTLIMMADGSSMLIEDIVDGDQVMGIDSRPRTVIDLHRGVDMMYKIVPVKGSPFVVNGGHILSLKNTTTKKIINISVNEWNNKSKTFKHLHKLWRVGVDFPEKPVDVPPYILGAFLGDGCITKGMAISNPDPEIEEAITAYASSVGCNITNRTYESSNCRAYAIVTARGQPNPVAEFFKQYGLLGKSAEKKYIPTEYLKNSRKNRLELLAGLLDTDGYFHHGFYEYYSKSKELVEGIAFVARSLGFACYYKQVEKSWQNGKGLYWRASISGDLLEIPCKVPRKKPTERKQIKSVNVTGFSVEPAGLGEYYGFECDGDHLYLMDDFTVTHNSGKGEMAVALTQMALEKNRRILFVVHRKDLVRQQYERFSKYGMEPGILQGNNTWRPHSAITVASIQTFSSRKKFGWDFDFDLVIIDEAHLCGGSKQYHEFLRTHNNLPILGLTATPFSKGLGKQMSWGKIFEDIVVVTTIEDLISRYYLVDCEIYAPSEPNLTGVKIVAGDYHQKQLGQAVNKTDLIGDIVHHWFKLANGRQTIVFATNIDHSKHIVEQFKAKGVVAVHVDCYMPEDQRNAIVDSFKAGEIKVLSNVSLFAEGFDCPETSCMILARPTRSLIRYIQMVGRVLRPAPGKNMALVLDHSGSVARLGFPTDPLPLVLDDGKANKSETKKAERKVTVCPRCKHVTRLKKCPKCGFERSYNLDPKGIQHKDGELQKIVRMPQEAKQKIYSALITYALKKGYQSGWVAHRYKKIVGVWPRGLLNTPGPIPDFVANMITHEQIKFSKRTA